MNPYDPITGTHRPCSDHDTLVVAAGSNSGLLDELKKGQRGIKSSIEALQLDVKDMKLSLYGATGTNGIVGKANVLQGSFNIIIILLSGILLTAIGFGSWNAIQSSKHEKDLAIMKIGIVGLDKTLLAHSQVDAHPVMEERYKALLHEYEEHLEAIRGSHPEK